MKFDVHHVDAGGAAEWQRKGSDSFHCSGNQSLLATNQGDPPHPCWWKGLADPKNLLLSMEAD